MYAKLYPKNMKIFRYEDLVADKEGFMKELSSFIGIDYNSAMLYPSWNGQELAENIAPWGTVLQSTQAYNSEAIAELSAEERSQISKATLALARYFGYDEISYLRELYAK
jgi:hypothetical protein